ncbi:hypothetical protein EUX98_g2753 [Antrodiella citrinella]|uniref:Uncharacterized protein n=1 Tax=Antrodiella citrinella TaxID=2447956 RepID=A0A4S4N0F8_9APHY|nr:hypothetical protein EUX98_g2753 [Antrodiella citrinella]
MHDVQEDKLLLGTPLSRAYGVFDMYKIEGTASESNLYHIEGLFSKLESQASTVIAKLHKAIDGSNVLARTPVTLSRAEVNTLRKFLFLADYRGGRRMTQFLEEKFDKNGRIEVETFKQKHNLDNMRAVWLFNLQNMLTSEHWEIPDNDKIIESDRTLYFRDMCLMQLAFFVAPDDCEFLMTDNGLGLWEGTYLPSSMLMRHLANPDVNPAHLAWIHTTTYPVSPKLLIMLRNIAMDDPQEGRGRQFSVLGDNVPDDSFFRDLPRTSVEVKHATPFSSFSEYPEPLRTRFAESFGAKYKVVGSRVQDLLTFRMHLLDAEQCARVNFIRLENHPRLITFKSPRNLLSAIRYHEATEGTRAAGELLGERPTKASYTSLISQLEHLIEHGVVPSPSTDASNVAQPHVPTSPPLNPRAPSFYPTISFVQDTSLIEQLRTRPHSFAGGEGTAPATETSQASASSGPPVAPSVQHTPTRKVRKRLMRREIYPVPHYNPNLLPPHYLRLTGVALVCILVVVPITMSTQGYPYMKSICFFVLRSIFFLAKLFLWACRAFLQQCLEDMADTLVSAVKLSIKLVIFLAKLVAILIFCAFCLIIEGTESRERRSRQQYQY